MEEGTMNLSAPWYTYAKKVKAFFAYDDDVTVGDLEDLDGGEYSLTITVADPTKAYALQKIIQPDTEFGDIHVYTKVALEGVESPEEILRAAFKGHSAVADVAKKLVPGGKYVYLRFLPEIIQFFDDDISDYSGNHTELINKVAENIFEFDDFCAWTCIVDLKENGKAEG
jgi:hypothetical protein